VVSSESLEIGKWTHVAFVLDGSYGYIYINNVITGSQKKFFGPNNVIRNYNYVGASNCKRNSPTNAYIDDLRIYSRALSTDELVRTSIKNNPPSDDLIYYWPLDNQLNDLINGADMYLPSQGNNLLTTDRFNKPFSALSLNNDFYRVPPGVYFNGGNFTVAAWVKVKTNIRWQKLIDFGNGEDNDNIVFSLSEADSGKPSFYVYNGNKYSSVVSSESLVIGKWTHVAFVFDKSNGYIYINDIRTASNDNFKAPNNLIRNWNYVGGSSWLADSNTDADIDDLRIYSRALGPEEIRIMLTV
jgi:hypothetical protein